MCSLTFFWHPVNNKLDFDATKLFIALKYQVLVAMEHCHTLDPKASLWIEVFGDVTLSDEQQIEVKYYADDLTDNHTNFWNTLNNWLKPEFDHSRFASLALLTTQAHGQNSRLKNWNALTVGKKLDLLKIIHDESEARFAASGKSVAPKVLEFQRKVLSLPERESLLSAIAKMRLITDEPTLLDRLTLYKKQYLRPLMDHRGDAFMDDMFGFMTSHKLMTNGWQVTGEAFTSKVRELMSRHMVGTLKFPKIDTEILEHEASQLNVNRRLFAEKLIEMGAENEITEATVELLHAHHYVSELIKDCSISQADVDSYAQNQYKLHVNSWRSRLLSCPVGMSSADLYVRSQEFYFDRRASLVERFCGFDHTPVEFRNGIYHMLADEQPGTRLHEFHWRMWK